MSWDNTWLWTPEHSGNLTPRVVETWCQELAKYGHWALDRAFELNVTDNGEIWEDDVFRVFRHNQDSVTNLLGGLVKRDSSKVWSCLL